MEYLNGILSEQYQEDSTKLLVDFCDVMLKKYDITLNKAAEFGCGTGLACFLLTKLFNKVRAHWSIESIRIFTIFVNTWFGGVLKSINIPITGYGCGLLWSSD